jgi:hypothetical protein
MLDLLTNLQASTSYLIILFIKYEILYTHYIVSLTLCDDLSLEDLVAQQLLGAVTNHFLNLFKNTTHPVKDPTTKFSTIPILFIKGYKPIEALDSSSRKKHNRNPQQLQEHSKSQILLWPSRSDKDFREVYSRGKGKYASAMKILTMLADYVRTTNIDITKPFVISKDNGFGVSTGNPTSTLICAAAQFVKDGKCVDKCEESWFS